MPSTVGKPASHVADRAKSGPAKNRADLPRSSALHYPVPVLIAVIAVIGFGLALGAIVTGYRGARRI